MHEAFEASGRWRLSNWGVRYRPCGSAWRGRALIYLSPARREQKAMDRKRMARASDGGYGCLIMVYGTDENSEIQ